jgi:hypothetical protein
VHFGLPKLLLNDLMPLNFSDLNIPIMHINFPPDFREFIELLESHEVEYLIVGGYAVGYHGHPRFTGDLDIWLKLSSENSQKILATVTQFGFGSLGLTASDFLIPENVIQLGYPPLRIDLLNDIDGVSFDECFTKRERVNFEGLEYNIISYDDLLRNKRATNRGRDLGDIESLEKNR